MFKWFNFVYDLDNLKVSVVKKYFLIGVLVVYDKVLSLDKFLFIEEY